MWLQKLFEHHNTSPGYLSLYTFHKVFLVFILQCFGCKPEEFHFVGVLIVVLAYNDTIIQYDYTLLTKCFTLGSFFLLE